LCSYDIYEFSDLLSLILVPSDVVTSCICYI